MTILRVADIVVKDVETHFVEEAVRALKLVFANLDSRIEVTSLHRTAGYDNKPAIRIMAPSKDLLETALDAALASDAIPEGWGEPCGDQVRYPTHYSVAKPKGEGQDQQLGL